MKVRTVLIAAALTVLLAGCASTPPLSDAAAKQVVASTPAEFGPPRYMTIAHWIPNSRDFNVSTPTPKIPGVVVITDRALVFQQWGGPTGLRVAKVVPRDSIRKAEIVTFGASARMVVESANGDVDSFAASDGPGDVSVKAGTIEMHALVSKQLEAQ